MILMIKKTFLLPLAFLMALSLTAQASENIRVVVLNNKRTVTLKAQAGLLVEGSPSDRKEKKMIFGSSSIGTRPVRVRSAGEFIAVNGKSYRGWIELREKKNGQLLVINELDIEDYLQGVIAEEVPHDWEFEALKAQAVASRTYALYQKRTAGIRAYHILATVNGQVYSGRSGEHARAVQAVRETEGTIITHGGEVIPAFYHASCGGHTENAIEIWGIDEPYLRGVDCDCQEISKYGPWEKRLSIANVTAALHRQGYRLKGIRKLEIKGITTAGRVKQVSIYHAAGIESVPAETLRAAIGTTVIPSVFFEIAVTGNEIVISGRGSGHGAGLCQWGAQKMAQSGKDYKAILFHYYPGTSLMKLDKL
jgi:stage II sporulation protein D